jgi:hypothetical protein
MWHHKVDYNSNYVDGIQTGWGKVSKIIEVCSANFWALFSTVPVMYSFGQKIGWATFLATFTQTHLVTLVTKVMFR